MSPRRLLIRLLPTGTHQRAATGERHSRAREPPASHATLRLLPGQYSARPIAVGGPQVAPERAGQPVLRQRGQVHADFGALLRGAEASPAVEIGRAIAGVGGIDLDRS